MKATKSTSVEEYRAASQFESLRKTLGSGRYHQHLEKPLAFWALPTDRRLPLVLLGRTLKDLLARPFSEISATRGIGHKKIHSLVNLLSRAANTEPDELSNELKPLNGNGNGNGNGHATVTADVDDAAPRVFDPQQVSEIVWGKWRASVVRHGLGHEKLGHLAPSLQNMTRVNWNTSLDYYTDRTLAEIRAMKTHGEKRVRAILEVFHAVDAIVAGMGRQDHLVVKIIPRRIDAVEQWIDRTLRQSDLPDDQEIFDGFIAPLLAQLEVDSAEQILKLAKNRLGLSGPITSVRESSRTMGLTRARIYQLLNEINDIILVRWPNGRRLTYDLLDKLSAMAEQAKPEPDLHQFRAAVELFYPSCRRGANGSFDPLESPDEDA